MGTDELTTKSPQKSAVSTSTPERKSFLQKACSLLDISNQASPKTSFSNLLRRGSGDNELISDKLSSSLNNSNNPGTKDSSATVSRLGQHRKMLADMKRERVEAQKKTSQLPSKKENLKQEVPNYMRSTMAKSKKEKVIVSGPIVKKKKSKSLDQQAASDVNLKRADYSEELSSEEDTGKTKDPMLNRTYYEEHLVSAETEALDVTKARLSHELAKSFADKVKAAADQLVLVYKRVSLDDDLDDSLRVELLSELSSGASEGAGTLRLVHREDGRSQGEIATAAMATINQFLVKQSNLSESHHFQDLVGNLTKEGDQMSDSWI